MVMRLPPDAEENSFVSRFGLVTSTSPVTSLVEDEQTIGAFELVGNSGPNLKRTSEGADVQFDYQIVELPAGSAQHGALTIPRGAISASSAISPVDPSPSFVIHEAHAHFELSTMGFRSYPAMSRMRSQSSG